jgi:anti-sigma regulatory factor (Ser/Thr protein kinase)
MATPPATGHQPAAEVIVRRWPPSPRSVARARRDLRAALDHWGLEGLAAVAELVLSELVTNAVRHARVPSGRQIETRYERDCEGGLRIEVHDATARMPWMRQAGEDAEGGRGLALVDALTAGRWGVSSRAGVGKLVWAHVGPGV